MVVDAVICHWITLVAGEKAGLGGFGRAVQWMAAFFYANDGLFASPRPTWIQAVMDVLTGLFDRLFLQTKVN